MKNLIFIIVLVASILPFTHKLNAQVFKPDSAATMLRGNVSYTYQPTSESVTLPSSLLVGLSYNKFISGGLYAGLTLSLESIFLNSSFGKFSYYQPAFGIQAGYYFGKPEQVVYPFIGAFSNLVYSAEFTDGTKQGDEFVLRYGPKAGVLFYVHENIGITVQGVYNFTSSLKEGNSEFSFTPDRFTQIHLGIVGLLF